METIHLAIFALSACVVILLAMCLRLARRVSELRAGESRIRQDAVRRSRATRSGHVAETFAPLFDAFELPPADARFIGHPIDYVVFDGLDEGQLRQVCFLEVKRGKGALSARQRQVRDAIEAGAVTWRVVRLE